MPHRSYLIRIDEKTAGVPAPSSLSETRHPKGNELFVAFPGSGKILKVDVSSALQDEASSDSKSSSDAAAKTPSYNADEEKERGAINRTEPGARNKELLAMQSDGNNYIPKKSELSRIVSEQSSFCYDDNVNNEKETGSSTPAEDIIAARRMLDMARSVPSAALDSVPESEPADLQITESTSAASDSSPTCKYEAADIQVALVHERYVDCSRIPDDASQESVDIAIECARKGVDPTDDDTEYSFPKSACSKATFPQALFDIVSDPTLDDIICWLPHGRAWHIADMEKFNSQILTSYFHQSKFASFMRQVNGWGFSKVQNNKKCFYYHEMFLRGRGGLLRFIRRQAAAPINIEGYTRGNRVADAQFHPNFYSIATSFPLPPNAPITAIFPTKKTQVKRRKRTPPQLKDSHTKSCRRESIPAQKASPAESRISDSMNVDSQVRADSSSGGTSHTFTHVGDRSDNGIIVPLGGSGGHGSTHPGRDYYRSTHPGRDYFYTNSTGGHRSTTHPGRDCYRSTHPGRDYFYTNATSTHVVGRSGRIIDGSNVHSNNYAPARN